MPPPKHKAYGALRRFITGQAAEQARRLPPAPSVPEQAGWWSAVKGVLFGTVGPRGGRRDGLAQIAVKTGTRSLVGKVTRALTQAMKSRRRR